MKRLKKKYYYGEMVRIYRAKYPRHGGKQTSLSYRFRLFLRSKKFWNKPSLAIGVLILKPLEYLTGGLGYIVES